jgi:PIN domain nuclease of toxin-antitoxin system
LRLLLDTHVIIALARGNLTRAYPRFDRVVTDRDHALLASAASLREVAIKHRIGKLDVCIPPADVPSLLALSAIDILSIDHRHATASLDVDPPTRDPFDRMLLAQCQVEGMRLVTADRALAHHPLA